MFRTIAWLSVAAVFLCGHLSAQNLDLYGDPLPEGAIARLGSNRFQHRGTVAALRYTTDGKYLTTRTNDWYYVWQSHSGKRIAAADLHGLFTLNGPDHTILFADSKDDVLRSWRFTDPNSASPIAKPRKPPFPQGMAMGAFVLAPAPAKEFYVASHDGKLLAGSLKSKADGASPVELWHLQPGKKLSELQPLEQRWRARFSVYRMQFSADNKKLVVSGADQQSRRAMLCDLENPARVKILSLPMEAELLTVAPDGNRFVVVKNRNLAIYDFSAPDQPTPLPIPKDETALLTLSWSPDGTHIAGGGHGGRAWLWEARPEAKARQITQPKTWITQTAFSPDGKTLVTTDHTVKLAVLDIESGKSRIKRAGHTGAIFDCDISANGKLAATCGMDDTVRIWDTATGQQRRILSFQDAPPTACRFTPDGKQLAAGSIRRLLLYDVLSGDVDWKEEVHSKTWHRSLSFSGDGTRLAAVINGKATVWEPHRGSKLREVDQSVTVATLSPDGKTLATVFRNSAAASTVIKIWDVQSQRMLKQLKPDKGNANMLRFSPDGKSLVMSGHSTRRGWVDNDRDIASPDLEDSVVMWNIDSGQVVCKFALPKFPGDVRVSYDIAFSPNGDYLFTAEHSGKVLVYQTATGELMKTLRGHDLLVTGLAVSADGRRLLSVSHDLTGLVWDVSGLELR